MAASLLKNVGTKAGKATRKSWKNILQQVINMIGCKKSILESSEVHQSENLRLQIVKQFHNNVL